MKRTAFTSWSLAAPSMGLPQLKRLPTGSEWAFAVIEAGKQGHAGPLHGDPSRWDWGVTVKSLMLAFKRHEMLVDFARGLTAEQRDALWSDPSEEAARVRRVV